MTAAIKFPPNVIQTFSGEGYDFQSPDPSVIHLEDIAHALSNMCRFAGHVRQFQSVAEHCVLACRTVESRGGDLRERQITLLHDAHEAYVWDCPRPFKPLLGDTFERFAELADEAILAAFFPGEEIPARIFHSQFVKDADDAVLIAEAAELMHHGPESWDGWIDRYSKVEPMPDHLSVHSFEPYKARNLFLHYAHSLGLKTEDA